MKGGQTPIHIQRWASADYHADEHVRVLKARRDYLTLTFYRHFLDHSFTAGGDLPADSEALAAIVEMPQQDVEKALAFCLGRLVFQGGDRLYQHRVQRDVAEELRFRAEQSERGKLGGRPKKATALDKDAEKKQRGRLEKPVVVSTKSPPASASASASPPAPPPAPAPTVIPTNGDDEGSGAHYVTAVLELYCQLPGTREKPTTADRKTAAGLYLDGYPIDCVRAGLLTATARRELRNREQPLPPIGSLAYFLDAIKEARASPPEPGYVEHLAGKIHDRLKGAVEESDVEA